MDQNDIGDHASRSVHVGAMAEELIARSQSLAKLFTKQDFAVRSITVVGVDPGRRHSLAAQVFRMDGAGAEPYRVSESPLNLPGVGGENSDVLFELHRCVEAMCGASAGGDLLVAPAEILTAMAASATAGCSFQAVAAVMTGAAAHHREEVDWTLRRSLFDDGLVGIGSVVLPNRILKVFLASDAVRAPEFLDSGGRGQITMSSLGSNGRFGNQLFQYAFMKLYALRHGMKMAVPDWQGRKLFRLKDPLSKGIELPKLAFQGFSNDDLALWNAPDPPMNVDFWGYFQEIPPCWQPHRHLLKTLFDPPVADRKSLDAWCRKLTSGGRRTMIAVHVRRTDYLLEDLPWFQIVPEDWYLDWLREIWPTLVDPVLFVATDDPDTVLPHFAEFSPKSMADLPRSGLPDHVRDFEILRRAEYLAICNSSFSRMAAILARGTQHCFLPSFTERRMVPHEPWSDRRFWARFENTMSHPPRVDPIGTVAEPLPTKVGNGRVHASLYFDVTDLLFHLRSYQTVSGIQRVQCELIRNLNEQTQVPEVNFTVFSKTGLAVVAKPILLAIVDGMRSPSASVSDLRDRIRTALKGAAPATVQAGDLFLITGAFWAVNGVGRLIRQLKDSRLTIGVFVHDILPISRPEYFEANAGKVQVRPVVEVLALADFAVTSSDYNKQALVAYRADRNLDSIPIHVVPLGHGLPKSSADTFETSDFVETLVKSEFILCVGTIEIRKNPSYLFNIWKLMVEAGRDAIPTLVLAGRKGWLVEDFFGQLKASDNLDGKIVLLHDLSDQALDLLYRRCLLTIFPSFDEGWGLPVGESLAHGKICLASKAGGVPEVGGKRADYIDPYNVRDGYDQLVRYLDDPELRKRREEEIAGQLPLRSWQSYAAGIMHSVTANMKSSPGISGPAAISLPANEFLPIGSRIEGSSQEAVRGYLSAESACISGWGALEEVGITALGPLSILRFRAGRASRTKVTVIFRFSASGSKPCGIHVRSESGAEQRVAIKPGPDMMVPLSCESDQDGLITVFFERTGNRGRSSADRSSWKLNGFLYIQPSALAGGTSGLVTRKHRLEASGPTPSSRPAISSHSAGQANPAAVIKAVPSSAKSHGVDSLAEFLRVPNSKWCSASDVTIYRREPIFIDSDDRRLFLTRYRNYPSARLGAVHDNITFCRLGDQYVSMSRSTEGAVFDGSGVAKDAGYIDVMQDDVPWVTRNQTGTWIRTEALAGATHFDGTFAIFFNGNLHNYYHWMAEGLLALDVLTQTIGESVALNIVLPRSMDIHAVLDHRASLRALGFDKWPVVEAPPPMIHVDEAVWLESREFLEGIPAAHVKRFQRRIASLYAERRGQRGRRLLVKRLGSARAISNFDEVEAFLHPHGFETVWLDGSSIEEQVLLFQRAEFVVGAHGAGLTNLLFCEPGTKVIEFMPTVEMRPFFWLISEKLGLRHAMQFCFGVEGEGFQASINVDIDKLRALYGLVDSEN